MDRAALLFFLLAPLLLALASATPPSCDRYPSLTAGPVQSCSCSAGDPSNPSARIVYTVSIPASCASSTTGGKCGAVLDIHGFNNTGAMEDLADEFRAKAAAQKLVVIQPTAPKDSGGWHDWKPLVHHAELVAFLRLAVSELKIDTTRVHVSGYSQGGFASWNILCLAPDLICSAAPLEASGLDQWGEGYGKQCFSSDGGSGGRGPAGRGRSVLLTNGIQDHISTITNAKTQAASVVKAYNLDPTGHQTTGQGFTTTTWTTKKAAGAAAATVAFTFIEHNYSITSGPKAHLAGHCFPSTAASGCTPSPEHGNHRCCGSFSWADAALDFFSRNPCQNDLGGGGGGVNSDSGGGSFLPANVSIPFAYRHSSQNPGSGNWWGASLFESPAQAVSSSSSSSSSSLLLLAGELKLDSPLHNTPTSCQIKRSTDGGATWGQAQVLVQDNRAPPQVEFGCGGFVHSSHSPSSSSSSNSKVGGTLFFTFLNASAAHKPNDSAWPMFVMRSEDGGETWGAPVPASNGTSASQQLTAGEILGHGIELSSRGPHPGRLVVPVNQFFGNHPISPVTPHGFDLRVYTIYSDDAGATWHQGGFVPPPYSALEATAAELTNGSLVMSMRLGQLRTASNLCEGDEVCHVFTRSDDGGQTWSEQWTVPLAELPVHRCQAALTSTADGSRLYLGAPMNMTTGDRTNYTIYESADGGRSWDWLTGVLPGVPTGYSDIILTNDGKTLAVGMQHGNNLPHIVGGGYDIAFARVEL